jgi:hypothetical protein
MPAVSDFRLLSGDTAMRLPQLSSANRAVTRYSAPPHDLSHLPLELSAIKSLALIGAANHTTHAVGVVAHDLLVHGPHLRYFLGIPVRLLQKSLLPRSDI